MRIDMETCMSWKQTNSKLGADVVVEVEVADDQQAAKIVCIFEATKTKLNSTDFSQRNSRRRLRCCNGRSNKTTATFACHCCSISAFWFLFFCFLFVCFLSLSCGKYFIPCFLNGFHNFPVFFYSPHFIIAEEELQEFIERVMRKNRNHNRFLAVGFLSHL